MMSPNKPSYFLYNIHEDRIMPWDTNKEMIARKTYSRFNKYHMFRTFLKYLSIGDPNECWEWQGSCNDDGYGNFVWKDKKIYRAHVAAYVFFLGSIPEKHGKKL